MALGPGKYDDLCTMVREKAEARGVILVVFEGKQGGGFCVQAPVDVQIALPAILRNIADQIERDVKPFTA